MTTTIDGKPTAAEAPQAPEFDPQALEAFMEHAGMHATAALNAALVSLGDRLGLWQALSEAGPTTAGELAARTSLSRRYLEEWLAAQAANGFVVYDAATSSFRLTPEATMVMADENSPALMIGAFQGVIAVGRLLPTLEQVFRSGDGIAWQDHDPEFFDVQERFSRPIQRQFLVNAWLAGVSGLIETLTRGARVADVGVGYGTSTILLAQAFPHSRFTGFDFHDVSIARARKAAQEAGVADRVQFEVADARSFPGSDYDLILFVDSLHDMGDPVAAARHARAALAPGGVLVTLDPVAGDSVAENVGSPLGGLLYAISTFLCTPTALAQHGPHALGAMAGEAALRNVLREAGFTDIQRVAADTPTFDRSETEA